MKIHAKRGSLFLSFSSDEHSGALRHDDYIRLNQKSVIILSKMSVDEIRAVRGIRTNAMNNNRFTIFNGTMQSIKSFEFLAV